MPDSPRSLAELRHHAEDLGLDVFDVWLKCFSFGTVLLDITELDAYLHDVLLAAPAVYMLIDQAIWELEHFGR